MSIFKLMTFVSFAASTFIASHAERRCPGHVPSVPLRQVQGALIVVSLTVNGAGPFDFMVDSGSQITTVDEHLVAQLDLQTNGTTGVSGVSSFGRKSFTQLAQMDIDGHRVADVLAVVDNLAQLHATDGRIRGIAGENFLAHFDLLIDHEHRMLCLDETGGMTAAMKGTHVALAQPYGPDHDLPFTRPLVVEARMDGTRDTLLFRLDSGTNVPLIYGHRSGIARTSVPANARILKRVVEGSEQDFEILEPQNFAIGSEKIRQVTFVEPMNSVDNPAQAREDGLLPTALFQRHLSAIAVDSRFLSRDREVGAQGNLRMRLLSTRNDCFLRWAETDLCIAARAWSP